MKKRLKVIQKVANVQVVLADSISFINKSNRGDIIVSGSHGGRPAARYAIKFQSKGVIFNDAGKGKDLAGISGLALLDKAGIMGATVYCKTARIGEGLDTYRSGIISAMNKAAMKAGVKKGMLAKEAVTLMLKC